MPDFVSCPRCGCRIQMLLASPGQRVRCMSCGHGFDAGAPAEPPPVERLPPLEALPTDEALPRQDREPPRKQEADPLWPDADRLPPRRLQLPISLRPLLDEDEEGLPFCPGCGLRVRWEAFTCPHCEEEFEDDRDLRPKRRRRGPGPRDTEPHRGPLIANLGSVSSLLGIFALCGGLTALAGLPVGIVAWVMANGDLERMRDGVLDSRGRRETLAARANAITGVALSGGFATVWLLLWLYLR
jgi:hypothetical protein